jgi:hypothetical protein
MFYLNSSIWYVLSLKLRLCANLSMNFLNAYVQVFKHPRADVCKVFVNMKVLRAEFPTVEECNS